MNEGEKPTVMQIHLQMAVGGQLCGEAEQGGGGHGFWCADILSAFLLKMSQFAKLNLVIKINFTDLKK
jgi:hypothetical protein